MALEHGDLFFVNRSGATYKIEAIELGDYLTNNELPGGDYIVNNGMLSITNTGNPDFTDPIGLHSANTPDNSILDFDQYFVVSKMGTDATVSLHFGNIKEDFLCNNGADSGFDLSNCDCLQLDFDYIINRIPCPDGAIFDNQGCLSINYCSDGMLEIDGREGGCLDVKVCTDRGMDISNGCIGLDMDYIVQNITCQDVDSGLEINGSCLSVNFDKVQAKIPLGIIKSTDQSVKFKSGGNKDLKKGDVDLSVDWSKAPFNNNGSGGGSLTELPNFKDCLLDPLFFDSNGCIGFSPEPDKCAPLGIITSTRLTNKVTGNPSNPGITIGIADDGSEGFIGFCGSAKEHRLRLVGLDGWNPDDACSVSRATGNHDMAYFMRDNVADDGDKDGADHSLEKRTYKNSCIPNVLESGRPMIYRNSADRVKAVAQAPFNPFLDPSDIVPIETGADPDQAFDVDDIFDALAGVGYTTLTASTDSKIRWERISDTYLGENNEDYGGNPQPYTPTLRADRLAQVHPALAEYAWSNDSFEAYPFSDDDPNNTDTWGGRRLKSNPDERTRVAVKPNEHTLIVLLMAANRRQKHRIAQLEARLDAAGIP